jgi:SPP1 gp7 family putative phage head morphogenesis protein
MAATSTTLRLQRRMQDQLDHITDTQVRDLVSAWADAWDEVSPDLTAALLEQLVAGDRVTRAQLLRSVRLRNALQAIRERLTVLADQAGVRIVEDLQLVIDTAGGAQASVIDSQLPPNAAQLVELDTWSRVDSRQIDAIVRRSTQQITSRRKRIAPDAYQAMRRELIRGVASGSNPRATAGRIVKRAEGRFNGGLTRAMNIARTETLDAHRAAAELGQAQHADVLQGWSWLATLDQRTCPSCWAQHGIVHPLDEPGPYDHQQGRCGRLPVLKPWKDLGLDIEEPPSLVPDAGTEFARLSTDDQRAVLGPKRYAAWQRGEYPMTSWSERRTTDGWRDSYVIAPVPQSGGRVSRNVA